MAATLRDRRKIQSSQVRPVVEQLEDRRLMAVWTVDDSFASNKFGQHKTQTIQAAVDHARAGDIINVNPGSYEENVVVGKRLTIVGNRATVDPVDDGVAGAPSYGFNLQANDIVIRGFRIGDFNGDAGTDGSVGINTSNSTSGDKIQNNLIARNVFCIYLN